MTMAFREHMNGVAGRMGVAGNPSAPEQDDIAPIPGPSSVETYEPDYNYPRIPIPPGDSHRITHRKRLESGQTSRDHTGWRSRPVTPLADERNLPLPEPEGALKQLPIRNHQRAYPHFFVPYDEIGTNAGTDLPPRPEGYQAPPRQGDELERAMQALAPEPWTTEGNMVKDISGFAGMGDSIDIMASLNQLFGAVDSPESRAAVEAVGEEAKQAEAEGESPSVIQGILDFGAQLAGLYVQKRQLDKMEDIEKKRVEALRLQQQAQNLGVTSDIRRDLARGTPIEGEVDRPFYESPLFLGALGVGVVGTGIYFATRGGSSAQGRKRRRRRR